MQIDFHHATTYVAARLAGFNQNDADIVAHAAQYVDDATSSGPVRFTNKFLYNRISSAHRMIDTRNTRDLHNHHVWIPFHFLPGNGNLDAGRSPGGKVVERLICRANSPVAREMVRQAIIDRERPYGLYRLGVAMHVFADTWAHQGFAGLLDPVNEVEDAEETGDSGVFDHSLGEIINDFLDDAIPSLGHGRATVFPDMPFLEWEYEDRRKQTIKRDNPADFCEAADEMCRAMQRYRLGDPYAPVEGIGEADMGKIRSLFVSLKEKEGEKRHAGWLTAIRDGEFSFGAEETGYITDNKGSWKDEALGTTADLESYPYKAAFLKCHWKLFQDAIQAHRFYVIHDLLPKYGICAA